MADKEALFFEYDEAFDGASYPFPWGGYDDVIEEVIEQCRLSHPSRVLMLGAEGNLAALMVEQGHDLTILEREREDAERLRRRCSSIDVRVVPWHDIGSWGLSQVPEDSYHRVISAYQMHHIPLATRRDVMHASFGRLVPSQKSAIVVASIAFEHSDARERGRLDYARAWDDKSHYMAMDEEMALLDAQGLRATFSMVAPCASVMRIQKSS